MCDSCATYLSDIAIHQPYTCTTVTQNSLVCASTLCTSYTCYQSSMYPYANLAYMPMLSIYLVLHVQSLFLNILSVALAIYTITNTTQTLRSCCSTVDWLLNIYIQKCTKYTNIYIYTYIHIHIHTYIHIYKYIHKKKNKHTSCMCNKPAYHNYLHVTNTHKTTGSLDYC